MTEQPFIPPYWAQSIFGPIYERSHLTTIFKLGGEYAAEGDDTYITERDWSGDLLQEEMSDGGMRISILLK